MTTFLHKRHAAPHSVQYARYSKRALQVRYLVGYRLEPRLSHHLRTFYNDAQVPRVWDPNDQQRLLESMWPAQHFSTAAELALSW